MACRRLFLIALFVGVIFVLLWLEDTGEVKPKETSPVTSLAKIVNRLRIQQVKIVFSVVVQVQVSKRGHGGNGTDYCTGAVNDLAT